MAGKIEIEVVIAPDGSVRLKTSGLQGEACLDETRALERALGKVVSRTKTSDYYRTTTSAQTKVTRK